MDNFVRNSMINCMITPRTIEHLKPGQMLYNEQQNDFFIVREVGPIFARLEPAFSNFVTYNGLKVKEVYVSNAYLATYTIIPRC